MTFCLKCGAELPNTNAVCLKCGSQILPAPFQQPDAMAKNRIEHFAALTLAICISKIEAASIARRLDHAPDETKKAPIREGLKIFGDEIERLERKRAELEEQFENRTGGS